MSFPEFTQPRRRWSTIPSPLRSHPAQVWESITEVQTRSQQMQPTYAWPYGRNGKPLNRYQNKDLLLKQFNKQNNLWVQRINPDFKKLKKFNRGPAIAAEFPASCTTNLLWDLEQSFTSPGLFITLCMPQGALHDSCFMYMPCLAQQDKRPLALTWYKCYYQVPFTDQSYSSSHHLAGCHSTGLHKSCFW